MRSIPIASIVALGWLATGCATPPAQSIPYVYHNPAEATGEARVKEAGAVYLWPPYTSAAVLDKEGKHCVLAASGAKTLSSNTEAAVNLGKALDKVEGLDVSVKRSLVESFTKLSAADEHAAFIDVALFHLCILEQNGAFKNDQPEKRQMLIDTFNKTIQSAFQLK